MGQALAGLRAMYDYVVVDVEKRLGNRSETTRPAELQNRFSSGFAVGGGLEMHAEFIEDLARLRQRERRRLHLATLVLLAPRRVVALELLRELVALVRLGPDVQFVRSLPQRLFPGDPGLNLEGPVDIDDSQR